MRNLQPDPMVVKAHEIRVAQALKDSGIRFSAVAITDTAIAAPLTEAGATGGENLDTQQRGAVIGEPIPIVFCRRVSGTGGVLISPAATEARFENSATNAVTGSYHLVLSEGQIDSIQVRDVFQRSCRVGSFSQTYDKRAGSFIPGNFIVTQVGYTAPECPSYCGTGGRYTGLSTMAFQCTYPDGVDQWNRQVHCFIRGGIYITRLLDSTLGPSNNVADLLRYLLRNSSKVPEEQIDTTSLLAAATFTNTNGFWFNGVISESTNVRDWISDTLRYFLLRQSRNNGKEGLRPLLPVNADGTIKITELDWVFTFAEEHIIPGSFQITYTPLADRKPVCINVLWRQQDDLGIAVMRTAAVRYPGTAEDGPFEQHDLSGFCASENHAVKVGTYILSKRNHVTHRLQIGVKPDAFNGTLIAGDLVRVALERIASTGGSSRHDYLYEVDRIGKSITGEVQLELTHFPIDENLASVVAQEVNAAVGAGVLLPTGLSGVTCDINSYSDNSVPADTSLDPSEWSLPADTAFETDVTEIEPMDTTSSNASSGWASGGGGGSGGSADYGNPKDELDGQNNALGKQGEVTLASDGDINNPVVGDTLTTPIICDGGRIKYYRNDPAAPGGRVYLSEGPTYTLVINDIDYSVYSEIECPDPTSPTGYSEPASSPWTGIIINRYYTPDNPLTIPASSGTLSVSFSGAQSQSQGCDAPFTKSPGNISSGGPFNYSVSNVVQIWMGANAGGIHIPCGSPPATPLVWDGSVYYKRSNNAVTKISLYGGTYTTGIGWGISSSATTNGHISFEFVTSVGGVIGPVYVGETAPPPVPIEP